MTAAAITLSLTDSWGGCDESALAGLGDARAWRMAVLVAILDGRLRLAGEHGGVELVCRRDSRGAIRDHRAGRPATVGGMGGNRTRHLARDLAIRHAVLRDGEWRGLEHN